MRRFPRSLRFYIAASTIYAAVIFLVVHAVYGVELGRAGLRMPDPEALIGSIDAVSFVLWLGISLIAGTILHRLATALEGARDESAIRDAEIGSIFALSQALSGSLEIGQIAGEYLRAARRGLDQSVTLALLVQDDIAEAFRIVAEEGPRKGRLAEPVYSASALPSVIRTRVIDHRQPLVLPDTSGGGEQWHRLAASLPDASWILSFAALPLVSQDRLVGTVLAGAERAGAITADRIQLSLVLGQFVAGALRTSLSLSEAEARAHREEMISRIARRARASLDPEEVMRGTVDELGRTLRVDRAVAAIGSTPDALRVTHEWNAPGVTPRGKGEPALPVVRLAAESGHTAIFRDVLADARLAGVRQLHAGVRAVLATPILVGGQLAGTLSLHQAETPRDWTADDVRLVEAVARELRVAMETARLFQSRERENERLIALHRASTALAAQTSTREVLDEILQNAARLIGRGSASLYSWDEETQTLVLVQNFDPGQHEVTRLLRSGEGLAGTAYATQQPLIVSDYQQWPGSTVTGRRSGLQAALAVPLARGGKQLGALVIRSYEEGATFTEEEARLLALFGDQAAAALTAAEIFARQRQVVEQLERLNRAKSEFVSIVSHEFRTPLTGIQGFSEMMRDEDLTLLEMREYAGDINKDAQRLGRMINEMLDLDRMESGRMAIHREQMDLNAVIDEVADRVRPNAPNHDIELELDRQLPTIDADRDRMTQVVSNLLNNAVKYSPTGGRIAVRTRMDGTQIHLVVEDEGLGIPKEALETIFERYSRVESQATRDIQGTGLGLPIVRQIVQLHGGRVWAESEIGRGSVFHVTLPLAATGWPVEA
ncbi:MAG TPA: GAF domain-containing protein [Candidatus Limnocylindria bacterium]|nr:GAF domain-containing protein [Candidatus Limnocylindria bacterium]